MPWGGPDEVTWATFSSAAKALVDVEEQALAALVDPGRRRQVRRTRQRRVPECAYTIQAVLAGTRGYDLRRSSLFEAAERLRGGNWFKIFRLFDDDDGPSAKAPSAPAVFHQRRSRRGSPPSTRSDTHAGLCPRGAQEGPEDGIARPRSDYPIKSRTTRFGACGAG